MYACRNVGVASRKVTRYLATSSLMDTGVQRVGMKDHANAVHRRQPQPHRETKGMEEGQDAQDLVIPSKHEHLGDSVACWP